MKISDDTLVTPATGDLYPAVRPSLPDADANVANTFDALATAVSGTIPEATTTVAGKMSAADKVRLDDMEDDADVTSIQVIDAQYFAIAESPPNLDEDTRILRFEFGDFDLTFEAADSSVLVTAKTDDTRAVEPLIATESGTSHTLDETSADFIITFTSASAVAVTVNAGTAGKSCLINLGGAGLLTFTDGTATIRSLAGASPIQSAGQYGQVSVHWRAGGDVYINGAVEDV